MVRESKKITCKNGKEFTLVFLGSNNAEQFLDFMHQVSGETHFMSRYEDEVKIDIEAIQEEKNILKSFEEDEKQAMISLFDGERIVGHIAIRRVSKSRKTAHRCIIGLGVLKEYHGLGLGTALINQAISFAKEAGYTCMELGVFSDNLPAQGLYKKMGFSEYGRLPEAFILDDGTLLDEMTMYRKL